jgi:N-acetyl sugar amidotransferase
VPTYCKRCVLPDTRPGGRLDEQGICHGCHSVAAKRSVDWQSRAEAFAELAAAAKARGAQYDCVIPVSGGKDGFWQVTKCLENGLHPLCVTYVMPLRNELGERNLRRLVDLGVDHIDFRPNPRVQRAFIERSFREKAMTGLVGHMGVFALPVQVAVAYAAPLVIYAENSAVEYGSEEPGLTGARLDRRWLKRFGVTDGTTAADWVDGERLTRQGLAPYFLPSEEEIESREIDVLFLGHFYEWDPDESRRIAVRYGFESRAEGPLVGHSDFTNIDDDMLGIHQHAKWYKFGITRSFDSLSIEIRNGRLSRDQAIERIREGAGEIPWQAIAQFCEYVEMSRDEYFSILEKFRNPSVWSRRDGRWVIEDFLVPDFPWPEVEGVLSGEVRLDALDREQPFGVECAEQRHEVRVVVGVRAPERGVVRHPVCAADVGACERQPIWVPGRGRAPKAPRDARDGPVLRLAGGFQLPSDRLDVEPPGGAAPP